MLDKVFAAIVMLGVIAFMGVVTVFVMEPDLWYYPKDLNANANANY